MKLEIALIKYEKDGKYDYTIESKFMDFNSEEEAKNYVLKNLEKDKEYYFYSNQEDVENSEHFDCIIANDIFAKIKKIKEEYDRRIDIIYTLYHPGQYCNEINEMRKDLEKKYNCKIEGDFEAEKIELL